jgi:hypothetical protein
MKQNIFSARIHVQTMAILATLMQPFAVAGLAATPPGESKSQTFKGTLYDLASHRQNPLFFYERAESTQHGDKRVEAVFKDPKGNVAVSEKLTYQAGKPQRYEYEQKQSKESGGVEFKDGKFKMIFNTSEGKTRTEEQDRPENLVVGPMLMYYLNDHWSELEKGQEIRVRIVVLDRLDTFGFKFENDGEELVDGKAVLRVKLKPTSFLISAVVAPIYFYFDKATRKLLTMRGRTLLRYQSDDKMRDLIAETVFE